MKKLIEYARRKASRKNGRIDWRKTALRFAEWYLEEVKKEVKLASFKTFDGEFDLYRTIRYSVDYRGEIKTIVGYKVKTPNKRYEKYFDNLNEAKEFIRNLAEHNVIIEENKGIYKYPQYGYINPVTLRIEWYGNINELKMNEPCNHEKIDISFNRPERADFVFDGDYWNIENNWSDTDEFEYGKCCKCGRIFTSNELYKMVYGETPDEIEEERKKLAEKVIEKLNEITDEIPPLL